MFKKISVALVGVVAAMSFASSAHAANWRAWNIHNDGHPNTAAMDKFAELVNEATDGEVTVEVFHGGVLGSQPDALEQVRLGAIEIGNFNLGPIGPMVKEANLVSLPFIFKSVPHMFRVLEGEAGETIAAAMAEAGVQPLAWVDAGYSLSEHLIIPECICVNTAKFAALSPEMQEAVRGAAQEAALFQRELWAVQSEQARKDVEAAGIAVNEIADKGPFQEAMVTVYDDYLAANPDMAKLVEMAQSTD